MAYSFTLNALIPAPASEIYEAWLDSRGHSDMTGGKASMSSDVGADVSAWDGYIIGRNLELVPGERIVQSWRTPEFPDDHADSIINVTLAGAPGGTLLTLVHSNVPDGQTSYEQGGWQEHYFEPMQDYFARRRNGEM
jgi:activator of HSP90 ATPase